ncbi:MAG: hypothetical protein IPN69_19385 [Acidobacteria bacterium]|nr:hypothetical protein [Acidobacteriota bacterium]
MPGTVTHQATHSTAKPIDQIADGATTVPTQNPDNCDGDVDLENNRVNIRCGDSTIPEDFKDASDGSPPIDDGDQLQRANQALDAVEEILWGDSQCSRFFGGPALFAFYRLKRQLIGANVTSFADNDYAGIRMDDTGDSKTTYYDSNGRRQKGYGVNTGFRVFGRVRIEQRGPFFNGQSRAKIGGYDANTFESRILQILHELAHMIYKPYPGNTLIEDDGGDSSKSSSNTNKIKDTGEGNGDCKKEIDAIANRTRNAES